MKLDEEDVFRSGQWRLCHACLSSINPSQDVTRLDGHVRCVFCSDLMPEPDPDPPELIDQQEEED